jgi:hypothetical protein
LIILEVEMRPIYRLILLIVCLPQLLSVALGQSQIKPRVQVSAFVVGNNGSAPTTVDKDNVGFGVRGDVEFFKLALVGGEVYGEHKDRNGNEARTRSRYFGLAKLLDTDRFQLWGGGEGYKVGNEVGGAGRVDLKLFDFIEASGAYGEDDYLVTDGSARIFKLGSVKLGVFYRFSKLKIQGGPEDRQQVGGLRLFIE